MSGSVWVALPLGCMALGACLVYGLARLLAGCANVSAQQRNGWLASLTALTFALAMLAWAVLWGQTRPAVPAAWPTWGAATQTQGAILRPDPGSLILAGVAMGLGLMVSLYSGCYLALDRRFETYYPLLLLMVTGLTGMLWAADLFNLYLFCELMSVSVYVLVAFRRGTDTAIEAGFKYLVMGSVGTLAVLMGISFVYREAGNLALPLQAGQTAMWTRVGAVFFLVGMAVKSAMVPLHTWLPDAHGRAPSSISAMLSGIVIQSAFYVWVKGGLLLGISAHVLGTWLIGLSLINMTLGNVMALVQTNTKRMLAYSTVAQMGYIMFSVGVGLRSGQAAAIQAGLFLIVGHAAMKGLAFLSKGVCHFYYHATTVAELRGTAQQLPLVAAVMSIALVGLAAIPPLAGFMGKWLVLIQAIQSADRLAFVGMAVLILNSLLSLGYYLPLLAALFAPLPQAQAERIAVSPWMALPLLLLASLVIAIGLAPAPWIEPMSQAGVYLLSLQ